MPTRGVLQTPPAEALIDAPEPQRWLLIGIVTYLALNAALMLLLVVLDGSPRSAMTRTAPGEARNLLSAGEGDDSWKAMALADAFQRNDPTDDIYGVFFNDRVKFQYPPSALLFWRLFPESIYSGPSSVERGTELRRVLRGISIVAILVTVLASALILRAGLERERKTLIGTFGTLQVIIAACVLGFTYYPLLRGHSLGQIQVFLGALLATALLAQIHGYRILAGVCIGLCSLIKPHYALLAIWALVTRDWKFLTAVLITGTAGLIFSIAQFGLLNHVQYLEVLRYISWHGEAFWPNQSVNGFLHRLLSNGDARVFDSHDFAPHHPIVFYSTLISSLVIVGIALWSSATRSAADEQRDTLGLSTVLIAATLASPVAWEHHYGALLPIFAVLMPVLWRDRPLRQWTGPLLLASYVLVAFHFPQDSLIFDHPLTGIARSHILAGALIALALCVVAHRRWKADHPSNQD